MKSFLAVLALLGLAAVPVYHFTSQSSFGIDDEHPLGSFEQIEAYLVGRDYLKKEREMDLTGYGSDVAAEVQGARMWQFELRPPRDRFASRLPRLDIIVDTNGDVRGVGSHFFSGSLELERSTSSAEDLARELWRTRSGADPAFRDTFSNEGKYSQSIHQALFSSDGVKGTWRKSYGEAGNPNTISDWVMLYTD